MEEPPLSKCMTWNITLRSSGLSECAKWGPHFTFMRSEGVPIFSLRAFKV